MNSHSDAGSSRAPVEKVQITYTELIDQAPMTGTTWLLVIAAVAAQVLDGFDFQVMSFALPGIIREFKLNPALAGTIISATTFGLAFGSVLFPLLADRIGRKPVFQWVLLTYAFGSFLSAVAPSYQWMLVARFITGFGLGAEVPIVLALIAEYAPLKVRHILLPLVPLGFAAGWPIAALFSIWTIPAFGWRFVFWAGIIPALLVIFVRRYTPESLRFMLSRGRIEEAEKVGYKIAKSAGRENVELVLPPLKQEQARMSFGQQLKLLRPFWVATVVLLACNFCSFIQTYGINAWLPTIFVRQGFKLTTSFRYTLMIFCVAPFCHLVAAWLMGKVPRKWAFFILVFNATVFNVLFGMSFQYKWPIAVLVGSQLLALLLGGGNVGVLFTFTAEIYPTSVRSIGAGIVTGLARFGAVLGPLVVGFGLYWGLSVANIMYLFVAPLFIISVITLLVIKVDTGRRNLEEIVEDKALAASARH
jgi:putative MFS transporter